MHSGRKKGRREFLKGAATLAGAPWTATAVAAETGSTEGYGYESTDPYRFDSGPYLFTDWRYVAPGAINYLKSGGVEAPLKGTGQIEGITAVPAQVPFGIHLEAQRAEKIGPLIPNDKPWEHQLPHSSLHFLGGKYRLWYWAKTPQGSDTGGVLCYAESSDVLNWVKPSLGLVEFAGSKENNIVFRGGGCTVFLDPSAPSAERLKMIYMSREESPGNIGRLKQKSPGSVSPRGEQLKLELRMAVSPDGFHWKRLEEPVMSHMSDTQNTVYYDTILQRYVGYFRMLVQDRRAIGRAETADYRRWPVPQLMFWPQAQDEASDDYYTNSKALYPGTKTTHLMFPTVYRRQVDSTMVRLASSADGKVWTWAPGTIMEPGTEGSWDGGCLFASFGLTEIPGERVALPYTGYRFPHKFPRYVRVGEIGLAVWRKERLVALTAPEEGEFYTRPMVLRGSTLHVNFQARRAVGIQVEVLQRGKTIKGRGWQDCDVLWGDSLQAAVTWKGSRIWVFPGQAVQFRFRLRAAKMFSFDVKAI